MENRASNSGVLAGEMTASAPEEFRQPMLADLANWAKVVKASGAKLD